MSSEKDAIYAEPQANLADFQFDARVAKVFPDMIQRSVPGYASILSMLGVFAQRYVCSGSHVYDLGCSLGAATLVMQQALQNINHRMIAVDNSAAMLAAAQHNFAAADKYASIEWRCADIREQNITQASLVVMNFTLQFIPPEDRFELLQKIYRGLLDGGALIVSEKIKFKDPAKQIFYTELHHAFKAANGYSDLEISQKRSALENVLKPDTVYSHRERLQAVGFREVTCWFQCLNFVAFLAIK